MFDFISMLRSQSIWITSRASHVRFITQLFEHYLIISLQNISFCNLKQQTPCFAVSVTTTKGSHLKR